MKTCPDCAESIQDAARKCRFCGFRFDAPPAASAEHEAEEISPTDGEAPTVAAVEAGVPAVAATAARAPSVLALLALLLGGIAVAVGGVAYGIAFAVGPAQAGKAVALATVGGLALGGILLAIGWGIAAARGASSFGGIFGGLALTGGLVAAYLFVGNGDGEMLLRGLLLSAGMAMCLFLHLGTLEDSGFDGTRLAAGLGLVGVGGSLFVFAKQWDLPTWIVAGLAWCGIVGISLFGFALTVAAAMRLRDA